MIHSTASLLWIAVLCLPSATWADDSATASFRLIESADEAGLRFVSTSGDGAMDYILEANGNGAALFDYDGDGDLDVLVVSGSTLPRLESRGGQQMMALYRNEGDLRFLDVTTRAGLDEIGWGMGTCVNDFDRDGDADFYLTVFGPNRLYRNRGDGSFEEIGATAGIDDPRWSHSCAFGDVDRDGDADLYVANYVVFDPDEVPARGEDSPCRYRGFKVFCGPLGLTAQADGVYRNQGKATFAEITNDQPARFALGVVFSDLDDSGQADFFVTNDSQHNFLFGADTEGRLEDQALLAGVAVNELGMPQASMGIAVGDYDNDLDLDLFITNFSEDYNTLYRNQGSGFFADYSVTAGVAQSSMTELGWGTLFVDLDNDGWLDLFVANGHVFEDAADFGLGSSFLLPNRVFFNTRDGGFRDASDRLEQGAAGPQSSRGLAAGDLDNDGDLDLVVVNVNSPPSLLRNELSNGSNWLRVALDGTPTGGDTTGTRITLTVGDQQRIAELVGGASYLSSSESTAHFGVHSAEAIERLELRPPTGPRRAFVGLSTGLTYRVD